MFYKVERMNEEGGLMFKLDSASKALKFIANAYTGKLVGWTPTASGGAILYFSNGSNVVVKKSDIEEVTNNK
jgi:hypothetical protein